MLKEHTSNRNDTVFWENHNTVLPDSIVQLKINKLIERSLDADSTALDSLKLAKWRNNRRLYTRNISLSASTQALNEIDNYTSNAVNINALINYQLIQKLKTSNGLTLLSLLGKSLLTLSLEQIEAERRLLSANRIQTKINPLPFNPYFSAYRYGVKDAVLSQLKSDSFHDFMRLHTISEEYGYLKAHKIEEELLKVDPRVGANKRNFILLYMLDLSMARAANTIYNPTKNKTYKDTNNSKLPLITDKQKSWVKYLFEPEADFLKTVNVEHLNDEEIKYLKRSSTLSLLNVVSPQMLGLSKISLNHNTQFTFSLNYLPSGFGEITEQNLWLMHKNLLNGLFIRQYINHKKTGLGVGYKLYDLKLHNNLFLTSTIDYWYQPENLLFKDTVFKSGFHAGQQLEFHFLKEKYTNENKMVIRLGYDYKTAGFMPGIFNNNEFWKLNLGLSLSF